MLTLVQKCERRVADTLAAIAAGLGRAEAARHTLEGLEIGSVAHSKALTTISTESANAEALRATLPRLTAELELARQAKATADLQDRAKALRCRVDAEMKEYATKIEPHLAAVASFGERHQRTRWEMERLNDELRTVGRRDKVVGGMTYVGGEAGFEDVQSPVPDGLVHPVRFFAELHVPALRSGTPVIWRGAKS